MKRYYYKNKNGKSYLNLKSPINNSDYIEITETDFIKATEQPELTAEQKEKSKIKANINKLKDELAKTDYKCLKFTDGALTEEEYTPIRLKRAELRTQINELEKQL